MSVETDKVPPVPNQQEIVAKEPGSNRVSIPWMQWFQQLREKINVLNESIINLAGITGTGFLAKFEAAWNLRTLEGDPTYVEIDNPDGSTGNPTVLLSDTVKDSLDAADTAVQEVIAGTNVTVDNTDPLRPIVNSTGGGGGGGSIAQVVNTLSSATASVTATTIPADNTIPQITEGQAYTDLDTTITPTSAASTLKITVNFPMISASSSSIGFRFCIFRDSIANAIFATTVITPGNLPATFVTLVSSGSTTATTFTMRLGVSSGTGYINRTSGAAALFGGVMSASMIIEELL